MISKPVVQCSRYDLIFDKNNILYKVQIKTSNVYENSYIQFATSTSHTNTKGTVNKSYEKDEVDFFATMYDGKCYLVPIELCGKRAQRLRFKETVNKQTQGVLFLKDFELEKSLATISD